MKIAVIGAGISGLSLAWYLQKRFEKAVSVTIFEQSSVPGGMMQTVHEPMMHERGPHTLRGSDVAALVEELGIEEQCVYAVGAKKKYIAKAGRLVEVPTTLKALCTESFGRSILQGIFRSFFHRAESFSDETIYGYFSRRFGERFCTQLIDPLVAGIWAGDPKQLSMKSCFPNGCDVGGFFQKKHPLFSFREGVAFLPCVLAKKLDAAVYYNTAVLQLIEREKEVVVVTEQSTLFFDRVYSTIPAYALQSLLLQSDPLKSLLGSIAYVPVAAVVLGYDRAFVNGFGFLCAANEERELLGCIFDSSLFLQHNGSFGTRLTLLFGGARFREVTELSVAALQEKALRYVIKYLNCQDSPSFIQTYTIPYAIAQYEQRHEILVGILEEMQQQRRLQLLGASFYGVGVNDCVRQAKKFAFCNI